MNQVRESNLPQVHLLYKSYDRRRHWEWQGVPVRRTPAGYEWRGRTLKSLSATDRAITGTPRSGPLFFGLKEAA